MTIRSILMAGVAGSVLAIAPMTMAQTQTDTTPPPAQTMPQPAPQATSPDTTAPAATSVEANKLVGKSIRNPEGDKIGDIDAVFVTPSGQVDSVIVGVGGFLGIGERHVSVKWSDLTVSPDGETVTATMTKDSLKAMPEYSWQDRSYRGKVFSDTGIVGEPERTADATRPMTPPSPRDGMTATDPVRPTPPAVGGTAQTDAPATATTPRGTTTKAFTKTGEMSADALIGATVKNTADETVGEIKDIHFGTDGSIKAAVVGVGGFLGVGERSVLIPWDQLEVAREGEDAAIVRTEASKDSLKEMPEYQM